MTLEKRAHSRLWLGITALMFILIATGVYVGARRSITDAALVTRSHETISRIEEVEARLRDAESSQRGYLLTGDVDYLARYQSNQDRLPELLNELADMTRENPEQLANATRLKQLILTRLEQNDFTLQRYEEKGLQAAQQAISRQNLYTSGHVRDQAQRMTSFERDLLKSRTESSRRSADLLLALALLGIPLGVLMVGMVHWLLLKELHRRSLAERKIAAINEELAASVQKLERHSADMRGLGQYTSMLQSCITPEEALQVTGTMLHELLPELGGSIYLLRASQDRAESIMEWGDHDAHSASSLAPEECWALRRAQPYFVDNLETGTACAHVAHSQHAAIATACIPLSAQGASLGFLFLSGNVPGPLPRIEIAEAAAEQLSLALSNLRLRETLRAQSIRDPLTGLYNRRYLEESLERELARCERRALPLSLLMLDLDHFKAYNDTHGHAGGDALLSEFGKLLGARSRGEDLACRYGGEEFTLILPETSIKQAAVYAEQIRAGVADMRVRAHGKMLPPTTVSIGLASFPVHAQEASALLQAADNALYRAKHEGRNRVVVVQWETQPDTLLPG